MAQIIYQSSYALKWDLYDHLIGPIKGLNTKESPKTSVDLRGWNGLKRQLGFFFQITNLDVNKEIKIN